MALAVVEGRFAEVATPKKVEKRGMPTLAVTEPWVRTPSCGEGLRFMTEFRPRPCGRGVRFLSLYLDKADSRPSAIYRLSLTG